jgi:hypothetical protein
MNRIICLIDCHNHYLKTLTLLTFQFYRLLLLYNIACTLLAIMIFWFGFGRLNAGLLFFAKILGFISAFVLYQYASKETYYYFRNAGCRMRYIVATAFFAEITVGIALLILFTLTVNIIYANSQCNLKN